MEGCMVIKPILTLLSISEALNMNGCFIINVIVFSALTKNLSAAFLPNLSNINS